MTEFAAQDRADARAAIERLHRLCGFNSEGFAFHPDNEAKDIEGFSLEQARAYEEDMVTVWSCHGSEIDIYELALEVGRELTKQA